VLPAVTAHRKKHEETAAQAVCSKREGKLTQAKVRRLLESVTEHKRNERG
jgi:hypothetical protein